MRPARFDFETRWDVPAPAAEVAAALVDLEHYPQWWPQVRAVARLDEDRAWVVCRSVLPYSLDLILTARRRAGPLIEVEIDGDLRGWARFELSESRPGRTRADYRQRVEVVGRGAGALARARPMVVWNHAAMMRGGERGLCRRLATRRS